MDATPPSPSLSDPPSAPNMASARRWARRLERSCCTCVKYFPLLFVYGLTSWAVFVVVTLCTSPSRVSWLSTPAAVVGTSLFLLLNWSYTVAVFTPPGSTTNDNGYSTLPTHAAPSATSFTVKSNGELRFCKKCQARKPDRAHHCSTCRRCVLKMDHHCPWLATCVGLHNQKAFVLFLVYTTLFCLFCFAASGAWVWEEIFVTNTTYVESLMPVNYIMLCIIAGIIGLAIGAFCGWHLYLGAKGQTTIECLEKTRYLSPLRRTMHQTYINQHTPGQGVALPSYGQQLLDMHQNAIPGITRPEEGEELRPEPSHFPRHHDLESGASSEMNPELQAGSRRFTYDEMERNRARKRYEEYLDEQDSRKLPNAFDLGPKRNLLHLFGPSPWLWPVPVCNTTGDGWNWAPNPNWIDARERVARERALQAERERVAGWGAEGDDSAATTGDWDAQPQQGGAGRHYLHSQPVRYNSGGRNTSTNANAANGRKAPSKADRILGRDPNLYADNNNNPQRGESVSMRRLGPTGRTIEDELDELESDDDDDDDDDNLKDGHHNEQNALLGRGGSGGGQQQQQQQQHQRAEAERRALDVVTNSRWGRSPGAAATSGGSRSPSLAGQLLRGPGGSGPASPRLMGGGGCGNNDDDDGVD
ncbi:Palmitoyltransferase pfa3 [Chaetomidium leptoderma]|uniref:Palmitoyltransferase n=1 Tax=Chaetomidium leptoderma TaxID=669021 RepID=A0AAN6ZZX2_9PEZI|nr:Palmitoyltransferase pfa3 [Chaetomidium leptoderma]